MSAVTVLARPGPLTRADLDALPDDGHRHELLDGALLVTPAPALRHQRAVPRVWAALHASCPADVEALPAPFDVVLADDTVLQPDVLVARRSDITERDLPAAPLLVVEVLSPSTRLIDLNLKHARYEQAGCQSYWVVDPDVPSLTAWDLRDGVYQQIAHASGDKPFEAELPFAITIVPARLVD